MSTKRLRDADSVPYRIRSKDPIPIFRCCSTRIALYIYMFKEIKVLFLYRNNFYIERIILLKYLKI